jgi:Cu(I)/Ag(I) efflux system membrane fusion protein
MGCFQCDARTRQFDKNQSTHRFSSDENDFINAKVNFIETQFSETDKTNRIRVYLNNSNLKFPIGLRFQGIVETNPIQGWFKQALVSMVVKKYSKWKMV